MASAAFGAYCRPLLDALDFVLQVFFCGRRRNILLLLLLLHFPLFLIRRCNFMRLFRLSSLFFRVVFPSLPLANVACCFFCHILS